MGVPCAQEAAGPRRTALHALHAQRAAGAPHGGSGGSGPRGVGRTDGLFGGQGPPFPGWLCCRLTGPY